MKLSRDGPRAITDDLVLVVGREGQGLSTWRQLDDRLLMSEVCCEMRRPSLQKRITGSSGEQVDHLAADFTSTGVVVHATSQCMRHELMSIAHPEQWHIDSHGLTNPLRRCLTPWVTVSHHGPRTCDDCGTLGVRWRQNLSFKDTDHFHRFSKPIQRAAKPCWKIPERTTDLFRGGACLNDE